MNASYHRYPLLALLVAAFVACPATLLAAPIAGPEDEIAIEADDAPVVNATCTLTPGPVNNFSFIWTPPEELKTVAWKVPTANCAACAATGAVTPTSLRFRMRWLGACSAQVQFSIVGAVQGATCLEPDPTRVLCSPSNFTITGTGSTNVIHTLPIPAGCCITGNAFVLLRFTGLGACASATTGPGLAASTAACVACTQFVTALNIFTTTTEWCSVGAANPMWLSLETDCCGATPSLGHSWGTLKTLYR
ncbi:MAG: hypothetical protein HOP12_12210 [Candidatus Eisenbacteria bacterium]|uniref:Fibronectin type III domain-containing protein n=1 Tax=Eiseniibacteriota bacterium TaxID=2212470 RepID=A0A849SGP3_UNCEI|nr:hypothetical protein [Candidatus Eisenbacteria bacterium]